MLPCFLFTGFCILSLCPGEGAGFQFVITIFDNFLPGNDANKKALVIHHGNVILVDGAIQKIFHIGICMHRLVVGSPWNGHDGNGFCLVHVGDAHPLHAPQKITFGDGSCISSIHAENGNAGEFPVFHLLYRLSECFIFKYVSNVTFGRQKKQNVHSRYLSLNFSLSINANTMIVCGYFSVNMVNYKIFGNSQKENMLRKMRVYNKISTIV